MRGTRLVGSRLPILGFLAESHSKSADIKPILDGNMINSPLEFKFSKVLSVPFSSSRSETLNESAISRPIGASCNKDVNDLDDDEDGHDDREDLDDDDDHDDDDLCVGKSSLESDERLFEDFTTIMDLLKQCGNNHVEIRSKLEQCSVKPLPDLVSEVLSRVRNDWETAFTFFLWAGNHSGYSHTIREYHSMISILGKMRKFDTAWSVIDEMRKASPSLVTQQTLLIMIRKYCAVRDVGRAINTFYAYKRFKFDLGMDEFHSFLSALCRYKNVQDAEHLLFCNRETYPFNTKSFNIVLNGWCNLIGSPREAERVWREMVKRNIKHDVVSYASIMSCYSKSGNLHKVLRLFDQMKKSRVEPDRKVYNAVVHALAKARFVTQSMNLMKTMEEKGINPNIVTYNSLIKPLCKARKIDEAKTVFDEMLNRRIFPTIRTYHAFIRILKTGDEIFDLLEKMRNTGCEPNIDTYVMLIRKFCRWRDFDSVFRLWNELKENGVGPDRSAYIVMIYGLFLNGKVDEAYEYYLEMKEKDMVVEPNLEEIIQSWVSGKRVAEEKMKGLERNEPGGLVEMSEPGGLVEMRQEKRVVSRRFSEEGDFLRQPQSRRVVREGGFSFWDD